MTQSQSVSDSRYCPRCGGLMIKPQGSTLYWHADNNHPRCDITNLLEAPALVKTSEEPPKSSRRKK